MLKSTGAEQQNERVDCRGTPAYEILKTFYLVGSIGVSATWSLKSGYQTLHTGVKNT